MKKLRVLAVMVGACLLAVAVQAQEIGPEVESSEESARQKFIRKQFVDLTARMLEVANLLEDSAPKSAKALREAVNEAQGAFIAEDMYKVADYLSRGLMTAAARTEANVIKELREVLATLRRGVLDLDERKKRLKEWEKYLGELNEIIKKQEKLKNQARASARASRIDKTIKSLSAELSDIVARQKELLKETESTPPGGERIKGLSKLRNEIRELIKDQQRLNKVSGRTPIDKLPLAGEAQKQIARRADAVAGALVAASKDPKLAEAMTENKVDPKVLSAAGRSVSQAMGQMLEAASQLSQSKPAAAAPGQAQAVSDLKDAEKLLSDAIKKLSAPPQPTGDLAKRQEGLAERTSKLSESVQSAAGKAGVAADPANLDRASDQMNKATGELTKQEPKAATKHQVKALKELEKQKDALAQLARKMKDKVSKPAGEQGKEQKQLSGDTGKLGKQMKASAKGSEPTPGQKNVQGAAKSQSQAAESLGQGKCGQAGSAQEEALGKLDKARKELEEAIEREREATQQAELAKIDAMLEKMLGRQKVISADTRAVYGKRTGRTYDRPEQLKLADLSNSEGALGAEAEKVRKMLLTEGTTSVFPMVLETVREDLLNLQKQLAAGRAGPLTQTIQEEVEKRLSEMIDAIRKALSDRRKKPSKPGGGGGGGGGGGPKPPLVPTVAELKLLRILQLQINTRTTVVNDRTEKGDIPKDQAAEQHADLAGRQEKVKQITEEMDKKLKQRRSGMRRQ